MLKFTLKLNFFTTFISTSSIAVFMLLALPQIGWAATAEKSTDRANLVGVIAQATPGDSRSRPAPGVPNLPSIIRPDLPITPSQPIVPPQPLPPPQEILPTPSTPNLPNQPQPSGEVPASITIARFIVTGSTVFTPAELARITDRYTNKSLDLTQLLQVSSEITQLYVQNGYVNSGAYIPGNQSFNVSGGTIEIKVIEGRAEDIVVTGTKRLNPNYIKSRVALGAGKPLKIDRLIDSLRLLQLDPLIQGISTELVTGQEPGTSIVQLKIRETPNWQTGIVIANNRTPSVGEIQAQISATQNNLFGLGDGISVAYAKSEASNILDFSYTLPLNPYNGTLRFNYSNSTSKVIEQPFGLLDINSSGRDFGLTYRQPLFQTPAQEFALGVTLARRETNTGYLNSIVGEREPYPTPGADANGLTRVTAARLFQDYAIRDTEQVFALRSQVSVGLNALNSTINDSSPDSKFFTWRGQAQYVRALAPNSLLLVRLEGQLADRPLLALEQIGLGGQDTVRGYRQDLLLADTGIIGSAEVRFPIFTPPNSPQVFQFVPFFDFGWGGNKPNNPNPNPVANTIAGTGIGLRYQNNSGFTARLDYGIPLTATDQNKRTGQEKGFYFSLGYNQAF